MVETTFILIGIIYLIYRVVIGIPDRIKRNEEKIDALKLQLKEINMKLDELGDKLRNQ